MCPGELVMKTKIESAEDITLSWQGAKESLLPQPWVRVGRRKRVRKRSVVAVVDSGWRRSYGEEPLLFVLLRVCDDNHAKICEHRHKSHSCKQSTCLSLVHDFIAGSPMIVS
jgi:hypothetical protein